MKNSLRVLFGLAVVAIVLMGSFSVKAQEEESESPFDAGLDIYSSYIWRGAKFGTGPAFQPWVSAAFGGLEIGAWGSVSAGSEEAMEMDLYVSYSFDFGLSLGVTDYYFGDDWTKMDRTHYIEPMLSLEAGDFSFTAAYMLMPGADAIEADTSAIPPIVAVDEVGYGEEGDIYLELGYSIKGLDIAIGAGDGAYTDDGDFNICNISLGTSKEIKITDNFALPLSGAVVLNPSTGGFFITAGISF